MTASIYLDHNATTPIDPTVIEAMEPYLREIFGNPSSIEHDHGHSAAAAIDKARQQVAASIGARPNEIIFTGSCTEANNLAILGVARACPEKKHIITSVIEHPAVIEPTRALQREGWKVTYLHVDETGLIDVQELEASLTEETCLVSIMAANNEVGTIQPTAAIGALCSSRGVLFHTDLAQLIAYGEADVLRDNIHLASLSAHKAYGPKGIGALYIRSRNPRAKVSPLMFGGGQERRLRPGTLNTPYIVGMGEALSIAKDTAASESKRLRELCNSFRNGFLDHFPTAHLNGHITQRIANNLSFSLEGIEPLALIRALRGKVSFSASSACSTDKIETSPVLTAMFGESERARGAFRIAPGRFTSPSEMELALKLIVAQILELRM